MQLANQEAQRFNHEYVGTEHMLLGLVKEGTGVAAHVLKNLDVDLRKIRTEIEKITQAGPDMVRMGRMPLTPRAKKTVEYAIDEAKALNHNYIGTEHILLGMLRESEGVAVTVLNNLGVNLESTREEILSLLGHTDPQKLLNSNDMTILTQAESIIKNLPGHPPRKVLENLQQMLNDYLKPY